MSNDTKEILHLPINIPQLVDVLDSVFPDSSPRLEWTDREVWFKAGQRSFIAWLLELKRRVEEVSSFGE